ncbi:MAG: hypothetical protein AAB920_02355, partial [Patescibacteria group bacterium]
MSVSKQNDILIPIVGKENLAIRLVDGTEIIATANDVFFFIDHDFAELVDPCEMFETKETSVSIFRIRKSAKYNQLFTSCTEKDLDAICLTQNQIKAFVEDHKEQIEKDKLFFFLFRDKDNYFVATALIDANGKANITSDPFGYKTIWAPLNHCRIVVRTPV